MSDRLQELLRQRALLQQHLAWLDQEIARAAGAAPISDPTAPTQPVVPQPTEPVSQFPANVASDPAPEPASASPLAADILAKYSREKPGSMANDARRGCLIYFFFAMASLII